MSSPSPDQSPERQAHSPTSHDDSSYRDDFTSADESPQQQHGRAQSSTDVSPQRNANDDGRASANRSPHSGSNGGGNNNSSTRRRAAKHPPIATISYPPRDPNLTVADFLDPSKPLVKSTLPLTKPKGPSFVEETTADQRRLQRAEHKMHSAIKTTNLNAQRLNERRYLKAQYEFEREKKLAEKAIYHRERTSLWSQRLAASPLAVDLVADNERIEEEAFVREREERHRRLLAEKKKRRIKNEIIVKALAEVPLLEEARRQKREMLDEERREKALRDVQRVEAIQERKQRDIEQLQHERQSKLDQRVMGSSAKRT